MGRVVIALRYTDKANFDRIRWKLVAHGAPYSREEAAAYIDRYGKANIRLLPLPKGQ